MLNSQRSKECVGFIIINILCLFAFAKVKQVIQTTTSSLHCKNTSILCLEFLTYVVFESKFLHKLGIINKAELGELERALLTKILDSHSILKILPFFHNFIEIDYILIRKRFKPQNIALVPPMKFYIQIKFKKKSVFQNF